MVIRYTYDSWGKLISTTGTATIGTLNPFRYRGYIYDTETGLYYLKTRYYDPEVGRFINADVLMSTGQGVLGCNMFCYCLNNPVNMADESGTYCNSNLFNLTEYTDGFSRNEYNPNIRRKNPLKYLSDDIDFSLVDSVYAERCKSYFNPPITVIMGASASGNLGFYSGSISFGIAFDQAEHDSGIGFVMSMSYGGGSPSLSGSLGGFMGVYNEPYRKNLSGKGWQYGGSVSLGVFSISHDRCINGSSTGVGVSYGKVPVEIHGQYTFTFVS